MEHDFSFNSGERQVGSSLAEIRHDHLERYRAAVPLIRRRWRDTTNLLGIDVFCGNGYGSSLLATEVGCGMWGIDGSAEAVAFGNQHFARDEMFFTHKLFPFRLPADRADFALCMESIEHVETDEAFLTEICRCVKPGGLVFLSTPNSKVNDLMLNPNKFHFRHYKRADVEAMAHRRGLKLVNWWGQDTYVLENGVIAGHLPPEKMNLREGHEGQFHIFAFRKRKGWW